MSIKKIIVSGLILAISGLALAAAPQKAFSPEQNKQMQQIVHDYIVNNPDVLVQSLNSYQQKQMNTMEQETQKLLPKYSKELFNEDGRPVVGNAKGNIVMIEFFDYQCPYCQQMEPTIESLIKANPDLKVIFFEWAIHGDNSIYAAKAALAAVKQNKYFQFHGALMKKAAQNQLSQADVLDAAKSVGLDINKLKTDIDSKEIDKTLKANFKLAMSLKLIGTPTFIFGNTKTQKINHVSGVPTLAVLQKEVDAMKS
jgi:protein-disulfide isomerase